MRLFRISTIIQKIFPNFVWHFPDKLKQVFLTFDDGPDENFTPQILEILQREKVSASFFIPGERAKKSPAFVKSIQQNGHTIGIHSYEHHSLLFKSEKYIFEQLSKSKNIIEQILDRNKSTINDLIYIKKTGNEIKYSLSQLESLSQTIKNMNTEIINNINQSFEKYSNKNIAHIRDVFKENLNIINEHLFSIEEMRRKMTLQINMLEKLIKNNISKTEEIYKISIRGIEKKVQKLEKEINDKIKEIDKEIDRLRKEQINVYFYNLINDEIKKRAKEISTLKIQEKLAALYEVYSLISLLEKVINDPEVYYRCRALYRIGLID